VFAALPPVEVDSVFVEAGYLSVWLETDGKILAADFDLRAVLRNARPLP
jgi:hypothetical protein